MIFLNTQWRFNHSRVMELHQLLPSECVLLGPSFEGRNLYLGWDFCKCLIMGVG